MPVEGRRRAAPNRARLTASVPEDVKVISVRLAASARAVLSRAWSRAARAARPSVCGLEGLPSGALRSAAVTSGRTGAPPASSRKIRLTCGPGARSAPAVVGLVDELRKRALEVLQIEMQIEDLVHADRLACRRQFFFGQCLDSLDLFHGAACDCNHNNESHLALCARDLDVEALLLVTEDLDVTAFQAASAHGTVVEAGPVADELDDAHRHAHITPHVFGDTVLTLALDASATRGSHDCRVDGAGRQDHPIARAQIDLLSLGLEHKSDRALHAIQDLFVRMAVRRVPIVRTVRPR